VPDIQEHNVITITSLLMLMRGHAVDEFWNVLADGEFTGELIPGSRRVPIDRIAQESDRLPRDVAIVVYGSHAKHRDSERASRELTILGFRNVRVFAGGLAAWKSSGRGVETLVCPTAASL
jgi:rhodanese-related sulfurtransferase